MAPRLLLISNSTMRGQAYLAHCESEIRRFLTGVSRVLFLPYALADRDAYTATARHRFRELGFELDSAHEADDPVGAAEGAEAVFVGGGNSWRLLRELYRLELLAPLRRRAGEGMPYMGSSAGTNMACPTIMTTNDMPIVQPPSFTALGLVPFQINPHYLDRDPASTHMGESRETRIREYLEENDRPVVGLREGTLLRVEGSSIQLAGNRPARVFRRGHEPVEIEPGDDLGFLWTPSDAPS